MKVKSNATSVKIKKKKVAICGYNDTQLESSFDASPVKVRVGDSL